MPKSAFSAQSQARVCAEAVLASLLERPTLPTKLINHCYSFVAPDRAISVTGVYAYQADQRQLTTVSSGETGPDGDWQQEARYAQDWYRLLVQETFG